MLDNGIHGSSWCTTPHAAEVMQLLGGKLRSASVTISTDEYNALCRLYGFQSERSGANAAAAMMQAGADRNLMRHAEADGVRIVAWLAKAMRGTSGVDPLREVVRLAIDAEWDVDPADVEWAEGNEDEPLSSAAE